MTSSSFFTHAPSEAEYQAAVAEFDALWNSNGSSAMPARMDELIALIDAFEREQ